MRDSILVDPPKDGRAIIVLLSDGQKFEVRYDPHHGAFGDSLWRIDEITWLTPWSKIIDWFPITHQEGK